MANLWGNRRLVIRSQLSRASYHCDVFFSIIQGGFHEKLDLKLMGSCNTIRTPQLFLMAPWLQHLKTRPPTLLLALWWRPPEILPERAAFRTR